MPNSNVIYAIARGTNKSAISANGSTFVSQLLAPHLSYNSIHGTTGKFCAIYSDRNSTKTISVLSILDNVTWAIGVFPTPIALCIMATAANSNQFAYSYSGTAFIGGTA